MSGVSVIICSVDSHKASEVERNILSTSGTECEVIIIDNSVNQWPIAKAYNEGAKGAKYDTLLFIHEDVRWLCSGWAKPVLELLSDSSTGVIGMAGSDIRLNVPSPHSWSSMKGREISNYMVPIGKKADDIHDFRLYRSEYKDLRKFQPAVTLDGVALFVRKEVWRQYPFDEEILTGFHCYDIDFTLTIHNAGWKNYVYVWENIWFLHYSHGSFRKDWYEATILIHDKKWRRMLPAFAGEASMSEEEIKRQTAKTAYEFLKKGTKLRDFERKRLFGMLKDYRAKYSLPGKYISKFWQKYFFYRFIKHTY